MSSINFDRKNKQLLKNYGDGSFDEIVNQLIDDVEDYMPYVPLDNPLKSTLPLDSNTMDKLKSFRLTESESYENIILRMLITAQGLNSIEDK